MSKPTKSNVFGAGFAANPSVAPGVVADIGSLLPRLGTNEVYVKSGALATDWVLSGPANVVTWTSGKTWVEVYDQITALTGPVICLVDFDGTARVMTNNGGAPTNLWNVLFWSLGRNGWNVPGSPYASGISVDSGFVLGADPLTNSAALLSINLDWQFDASGGVINPINTAVYCQFDGGQLTHSNGAYLFSTFFFRADLTNNALLIGNGGTALVQLQAGAHLVGVSTGASLGAQVFDKDPAAPAQIVDIAVDTNVTIDGGAFLAGVTPAFYIANSTITRVSADGTLWIGTVDNAGVLTFAPF